MKNIVFVINSLTGGGAERVVTNAANYLAASDYRVAIITFRSRSSDFYILSPKVERYVLDFARRNFNSFYTIMALRRILRSESPDYIVGMMTEPSILTLIASIGLRSKIVISERNHPPKKFTPFHWRALRWLLYRFSYSSVVLTNQTAAWMASVGCKRVHVIPVSIDLPLPIGSPILKPDFFVEDDEFLFLSVGRLDYQKGFDLLLLAFRKIANAMPNAKLIVIGEGKERDRLQALRAELRLDDRVIFPGRAGNICDWYKRANVFVFSSRFEGFGNALVEAMGSGCACISFDCDVGPGEVIRNEVNGLLVDQDDITGLAEGMLRLFSDKTLRSYLAENAISVRDYYSSNVILKRWLQVFSE